MNNMKKSLDNKIFLKAHLMYKYAQLNLNVWYCIHMDVKAPEMVLTWIQGQLLLTLFGKSMSGLTIETNSVG